MGHGHLCPYSYASDSGAAKFCQRGGGGGCFPTVERYFGNLCMKTGFFAHEMLLLGGRLCEVSYTSPLLPLFLNFFYSNQRGGGGGGMGAMKVVQPGLVNGGQSEGAKCPNGGNGGSRSFERAEVPATAALHELKCHI